MELEDESDLLLAIGDPHEMGLSCLTTQATSLVASACSVTPRTSGAPSKNKTVKLNTYTHSIPPVGAYLKIKVIDARSPEKDFTQNVILSKGGCGETPSYMPNGSMDTILHFKPILKPRRVRYPTYIYVKGTGSTEQTATSETSNFSAPFRLTAFIEKLNKVYQQDLRR